MQQTFVFKFRWTQVRPNLLSRNLAISVGSFHWNTLYFEIISSPFHTSRLYCKSIITVQQLFYAVVMVLPTFHRLRQLLCLQPARSKKSLMDVEFFRTCHATLQVPTSPASPEIFRTGFLAGVNADRRSALRLPGKILSASFLQAFLYDKHLRRCLPELNVYAAGLACLSLLVFRLLFYFVDMLWTVLNWVDVYSQAISPKRSHDSVYSLNFVRFSRPARMLI